MGYGAFVRCYLKNIRGSTDEANGKPFATFPGSMAHYHHFAAGLSVTRLVQIVLLKIFVTSMVPKVTHTGD
jgi:hypothetical protein